MRSTKWIKLSMYGIFFLSLIRPYFIMDFDLVLTKIQANIKMIHQTVDVL